MDIRRLERAEYASFLTDDNVADTPLYPVDAVNQGEFQFDPRELRPDPEIPFAPDDQSAYRDALDVLAESNTIRLSERTTLPTFIYPNPGMDIPLQIVEEGTSLEKASEDFLSQEQYRTAQIALTGVPSGDVALRFGQWSRWGNELLHSRLVQVLAQEDIPIYGSQLALTYKGNDLLLVTSTLYPIENSLLTDRLLPAWQEASLDWYENRQIENLPDFLQPNRFLQPPHLWSPDARFGLDRCVFPYDPRYQIHAQPDGAADLREVEWYLGWEEARWSDRFLVTNRGGGIYRPAWRVILEDQAGNHWLTLIDAESQQALWLYSTHLHAVNKIFLTSKAALTNQPSDIDLPTYTNQGDQRITFIVTDSVQGASRFVNPDSVVDTVEQRKLTANVYYHLDEIQQWYKERLRYYGFALTSHKRPNGYDQINVFLHPSSANWTFYRWSDHRIYIGADASGPSATAIFEPGLDPEVLYHEYTHAVVHLLLDNADITYLPGSYDQVLQEAWAYHLGCAKTLMLSVSGQIDQQEVVNKAIWADSAYRNQSINLAASVGPYSSVANQGIHTIGVWWARFFWLFFKENSLSIDAADKLLLQLVQEKAYTGLGESARNTFAMTLLASLAEINPSLASSKKIFLKQKGFAL